MKDKPHNGFPDPRCGPASLPLAQGGALTVDRLLTAYEMGIFPWYSEGEPVYWWCPDPRFILLLSDFHYPHSLRRELKNPVWKTTIDTAFEEVIRACAVSPRHGQKGTWITDEMIAAYTQLHRAGFAHSVECWREGKLAGGLYGVSLGNIFFGESMFHRITNASKVALARLVNQLKHWGFHSIDCQMPTVHLEVFGAKAISRNNFLDLLKVALKQPTRQGSWESIG